jgi:hypothetical protein
LATVNGLSFLSFVVRLLHHAIVIRRFHIEGASYRLRQHADLIPENLRLGPLAGITQPPRRRGRTPSRLLK